MTDRKEESRKLGHFWSDRAEAKVKAGDEIAAAKQYRLAAKYYRGAGETAMADAAERIAERLVPLPKPLPRVIVATKRAKRQKNEHHETAARRIHVMNFIVKYKTEHDGNSPNIREICDNCFISSTSVAQYYLQKLQKLGLINFGFRSARSIEVVGGSWHYEAPHEAI